MNNTADKIPSLLATAQRAWERGNRGNALALMRMLMAQYPDDQRVIALMASFEHQARQLAQQHTADTPALQDDGEANAVASSRITAVLPELQSSPTVVESSAPIAAASMQAGTVTPQTETAIWPAVGSLQDAQVEEIKQLRWPIYVITAVALTIILLTVLWRWASIQRSESQEPAIALTPSFAAVKTLIPTLAADAEIGSVATAIDPVSESSGLASPTIFAEPTATLLPTPRPLPSITPSPQPTITPHPVLSQGQIIQSGPWTVSLLRQEHAMRLDGSIGSLQPRGRFILALLSVGYAGNGTARIPDTLVVLEDDQGQRYQADPNASTSYLDTFGRGQYGDISLSEEIPPDAGNLSIPFIFDVPVSAQQLHLIISGENAVWVIP